MFFIIYTIYYMYYKLKKKIKYWYFTWLSGCRIPPLKIHLQSCYTKKELVDPFFSF